MHVYVCNISKLITQKNDSLSASVPSFISHLILIVGPVKLPRQGQLKEIMILQTLAQAIYQTTLFMTQNHKRNSAFPRHNLTLRAS